MARDDAGETGGPATLLATWEPRADLAARWNRSGGPWDGPDLDMLLSAGRGEIVDGATRLSPEAVETAVAALAGALSALGVRPGQVVAWQLSNCLAAALCYRACWRLGAVAAPILHSFGPAERAAALAQVAPALTLDLPDATTSDPDALLDHVGALVETTQTPGAVRPVEPVAAGSVDIDGARVAVVLFTSGSTGTPKAVLHTHRALSWKARLMAQIHGLGPGDAVLMPAPMAHVSGLLNGVLVPQSCGMRAVLMRRFDPAAALALVAAEQVSFLAGPPTFFIGMAELVAADPDAHDVTSIRLVSSGGAAVTPAFVEATAERFGCRVKRTYGSTEAPTVTTSTEADPVAVARDTDGRAVGEVELRICDPASGLEVPPGTAGELFVRGPELFAGYAVAGQNQGTLDDQGWFRTGDLGVVDAQGWLRITGRLKDVIIRGGENISATEVEGVLEAHPQIIQAVAVGYPDERLGERVCAFVVGPTAEAFDVEACAAWFAERGVARFKTPERVVVLDALPLLGSGKADRSALSTRALELSTPVPAQHGRPS